MRRGHGFGLTGIAVMTFVSTGALSADRLIEAGSAAIELDGIRAVVKEASGGSAYADVVTEAAGPDRVARKHLGGVKYETISVKVGADMPRPLQSWITDTLNLKYTRKNGAIIGADGNFKEVARRTFLNGLLSEVVFPELDAASRDAAYITVRISPEQTRFAASAGTALTAAATPAHKVIMASAFRVAIDGLDTSRVLKVEPIDIKMKIAGQSVGEARDFEKQPVSLEVPNIVFYVAESHSDTIAKWHEDFVVKGQNGRDKEKNGRIDVLTANLAQTIYSLELKSLGIVRFTPEPYATDDKTRRIKVEMYVDQVRLVPGTLAQ